jgi:hypothetical protein
VLTALQSTFKGTAFSAEYFFYNSALRVIRDLAICNDETQRCISKKDFLNRVDTSSALFNEWFVLRKGKNSHFSALRKQYFTTLNVSLFERFFLIEVDAHDYERSSLKELILLIGRNYSKLSQREPESFCPYLYFHGLEESELVEIKTNLVSEGFRIVDGYSFQGASFSERALVEKATHQNGIKLKIINSLADLQKTIEAASGTKHVYQFYRSSSFYVQPLLNVTHTQIGIEKTNDIKEIV